MTDSMNAQQLRSVNSLLNKMANERRQAMNSAERLIRLANEMARVWPDKRAKLVKQSATDIIAILSKLP